MSYPPQGGYPPAQGGNYPPPGAGGGYPPGSGSNVPPPGNYPPPGPPSGSYPPANYPPPASYPPPGPPQDAYPPPGNYPPPGGYPPATGGYPPQDAYPPPGQAPSPYSPYAPPPGQQPYTPPPNPYGQQYSYNSGFGATAATTQDALLWWRVLTAVIDFIVIGVARAIIGALIAVIFGVSAFSFTVATGGSSGFFGRLFAYSVIVSIVGAAILVAYEGIMIYRYNGKTVGSLITNVQVVSADGQPMTQEQSFRRAGFQGTLYLAASIIGSIPLIGWIAWIGMLVCYASMFWDANKQTYHDKYAKTIVVRSAPQR